MRAIAYARCSTLLSQTPDNQLIPIREFAKNRKFDLVAEIVDRGVSGTREKRPGLDRLMSEVRKGRCQIVIVSGFDRLGRNVKHLLQTLEELNFYHCSLVSLREGFDTSSPQGRMIFTVIAAVAAIERDLISERIKTSLAARKLAAQQGNTEWRCGRPAKVNTDLVQKVMKYRQEGLSVRQIEHALQKQISAGSVHRILKARSLT